jgi:hypothetical protein
MRKILILLKNIHFSTPTENFLQLGLALILLCVLRLGGEILTLTPYSTATAARLGGFLEYILAALAALSAIAYLMERALRDKKKY